MRCKKHLSDHSSTVGVCASCLRDRLFSLIHAQSLVNPAVPNPKPDPNLNPNPPPLIFPRSVSPYISRRKSDPIQRFYSTPLVAVAPTTTTTTNTHHKKKFSLISKLFRSRSDKSIPAFDPPRRNHYNNNKGMSPDHRWEEELDGTGRGMARPSPSRSKPSPSRSNVANLALCLSPLVRASPTWHWGVSGSEAGYSGEIRVSATGNKPHLSAAASLCSNRSRKLADFGRLDRNR